MGRGRVLGLVAGSGLVSTVLALEGRSRGKEVESLVGEGSRVRQLEEQGMVVVTGVLSREQGEQVAELESVSRGSRAGGSRGELAKAHYWQSTPGR